MFYQIEEVYKNEFTAGTKAPQDIAIIAKRMGFKSCLVHMNAGSKNYFKKSIGQLRHFIEWRKIFNKIPEKSIILLQHTYRNKQIGRTSCLKKLKEDKHCAFISIIHDVEELREVYLNDFHTREFDNMLEISDVVIAHNDVMKKWLIEEKHISEHRIVSLEVFDYLSDSEIKAKKFTNNVTIAGNLNPQKVGYLPEINKIKDITFDLYGLGWGNTSDENIIYHGAFKPEELTSQLSEGFGLVWDGDSIDTCSGKYGTYLRYNNPHKLSLYISSGLPVIIWSGAAEAEFVEKNNIGISVNSLCAIEHELNNLTQEQYNIFVDNVKIQAQKLRIGFYTEKAINQAIGIVKETV